jgi:threonine/homoserine/homoserine lactone efflux protein
MRIHLLSFITVAGLIVITPGVDMALVARNALIGGREPALATALGVNLGVAVWALGAALGLAAAVKASQTLFDAVRLAGAAYLVLLGPRSVLNARRPFASDEVGASDHAPANRRASALRQGLMTNLLNPKMALFFTSLLPQFVDRGGDPLAGLLTLGAVFNLLGLVWLTGLALVVGRSRVTLTRPWIHRLQERLTGTVLIGLGIRIALDGR